MDWAFSCSNEEATKPNPVFAPPADRTTQGRIHGRLDFIWGPETEVLFVNKGSSLFSLGFFLLTMDRLGSHPHIDQISAGVFMVSIHLLNLTSSPMSV